jgi:REP element-mobilizing transposase RayT
LGRLRERLEQIIRQVADELEIKVLELAINPDHIHLSHISLPNNTNPQDYEEN